MAAISLAPIGTIWAGYSCAFAFTQQRLDTDTVQCTEECRGGRRRGTARDEGRWGMVVAARWWTSGRRLCRVGPSHSHRAQGDRDITTTWARISPLFLPIAVNHDYH